MLHPQLAAALLAAPPVLLPAVATDTTYSIGTHGAELRLDDDWERHQVDATLGPDQFLGTGSCRGVFLAFVELEGLYTIELDFRRGLEDAVGRITSELRDPEVSEIAFAWLAGRGHGSITLEGREGLRAFAYELHLVGRDGLAYLVLLQGPQSRAGRLRRAAGEVAEGFALPGPTTEWGLSALPTVQRARFSRGELCLTLRPSVLRRLTDLDDAFAGFTTSDEEFFLMALEFPEPTHLGECLDEARAVLEDDFDAITERSRRELVVGGRPALESVCVAAEDPPWTLRFVAVEIAPDLALDLRFIHMGPPEPRADHVAAILESIEIELDARDAIPRGDVAPAPLVLAPPLARLLEESEELARLAELPRSVAALESGDLLAVLPDAVLRVPAGGGEPATLYREGEDRWDRRAALLHGALLVRRGDGSLARVRDLVAEPAGFDAATLCTLPGERAALLLRAAPPARLSGLESLPPAAPDALLRRDAAGHETALASLPIDLRGSRVAADASGAHALVVASEPGDSTAARRHLLAVDLAAGGAPPRALGRWHEVDALGVDATDPATPAWLVSGRPASGPRGVHRVPLDGAPSLLLGGERLFAARLDAEGLLVALAPRGESGARVLRVPRATLGREGLRTGPLSGAALQRLAERALAELGRDVHDPALLATRADVQALVERAVHLAQAEPHGGLHLEPELVDRQLEALYLDLDVGPAALRLLTALLAECLLRRGAAWVDGPAAPTHELDGRPAARVRRTESPFAIGYLPDHVVVSTLFDEDGWWSPATTILSGAEGREILLGGDPAALVARLEAATELAPSALGELPTEELRALLERHPGNAHLRQTTWKRLAARGRVADVEALAASWARRDDTWLADLRAWTAARLAREPEGEALTALVVDLEDGLRGFPDDPGLLLLLGHARARTPDGAAAARACYARVLELRSWGPVAEEAEAALR